MGQLRRPLRSDPFDRALGMGRGRADAPTDVLLVEDHGVPGSNEPVVAVFASRSAQVSRDIACIHAHAAAVRAGGGVQAKVSVRRVSLAEFVRVRESDTELGPGDLDRATAAEEAAIMGAPWPLPAS